MQFNAYGIWTLSKNQSAARQFLIDYRDDWPNQLAASCGFNNPFLKGRMAKPMPGLGTDPKLSHLQDAAAFVRPIGHLGPPSAAASDALANHHATDIFTSHLTRRSTIDEVIAQCRGRLEGSLVKFPL